MVNDYLLEAFLTRYYLLDAICGDFMTESAKKNSFFELARVFCLDGKKVLRDYYEASCRREFKEIKRLSEYERFCRILEFAKESGQRISFDEVDRKILAQKKQAMLIKKSLFEQDKNLTCERISATLMNLAENGSIDAMVMLSYMEYHGICLCRDETNAVKRVRHCAKWNDLFGNLMGIAYDEGKRVYYDTLYTVFRNASRKPVFDHICQVTGYDGEYSKNPVARIIEKAFALGIIKPNQYDRVFSMVAFSGMIPIEDKEKVLLNKQNGAIAALSDLPFDATWEREVSFDEGCSDDLPLVRSGEIKKIMQNISVARNCPKEAYAPLLIVTSDEYVSDMYANMLGRGFSDSDVVVIDAGTLTLQDFRGDGENVFIRGLSETKSARTVFIFEDCEELAEGPLNEMIKALDNEYRTKYKLFSPPVSFDISGCLIIMIASERNEAVIKLQDHCDTVWTEKINNDEKSFVVNSLFARRAKVFGKPEVILEDNCIEFLSEFDMAHIRQVIDAALRAAIFDKTDSITLETVKTICKERNITAARRGFGYVGGDYSGKN